MSSARFQGQSHTALTRQLRRIRQCRIDVRGSELRVAAHNFFARDVRRNVVDDDRHHNARAADARLSVANGRIDTNVLAPVFHAQIVTRRILPNHRFCAPECAGGVPHPRVLRVGLGFLQRGVSPPSPPSHPHHPNQILQVLLTRRPASAIFRHVARQTHPSPTHPTTATSSDSFSGSLLPYFITSPQLLPSKSRNPFRIRTSTKANIALCNPNRINAVFHNYAHFHQISARNPSIYNTYKTPLV